MSKPGRKPKQIRSRAGRPPKGSKPLDPEKISERIEKVTAEYELDLVDKQILKLKSIDPHLSCREIGEKIGIHWSVIAYRLRKPRFKQVWDSIMETTQQAMERNARRAAQRLYDLINHKNERIALDAIKIALSPWMNQFTHQVNVQPSVTYKTTVQADSTLLQEVIEAEIVGSLPPSENLPVTKNEAEKIESDLG